MDGHRGSRKGGPEEAAGDDSRLGGNPGHGGDARTGSALCEEYNMELRSNVGQKGNGER